MFPRQRQGVPSGDGTQPKVIARCVDEINDCSYSFSYGSLQQ